MLGMSSLMEKRGPHRVQISVSPSRRRGALPRGHTKSDSNASFTMGQLLRRDVSDRDPIPPPAIRHDPDDGRGFRWLYYAVRGRWVVARFVAGSSR